MQKTREYHALSDACTQEGCPICRLTQENVTRYLDNWKYELFTDVELRQELRRTQGFCYLHTWQLVRMGAMLPLAQAYRDILSDELDEINQENSEPVPSGGLFRRFLEPKRDTQSRCPACVQQTDAEYRHINTLRKALLYTDFVQQLSTSQGLCLRHFRLTSTLKMSDTPGNWLTPLREAQRVCLHRLDQQLGELIRKHDYRFKDEEKGPEMASWRRAAGLVAGEEPTI